MRASAQRDRRVRPRAGKDRRAAPRPKLGDFKFADSSSLISPVVVTGMVRLIEFSIVACIGLGLFQAYLGGPTQFPGLSGYVLYGFAVLTAAVMCLVSFQAFQLYDISVYSSVARQLPRVAAAWTLVFAFLLALAFFLKLGVEYSCVWVAAWYVTGLLVLCSFRTGLALTVQRWANSGRLNRRAVIVGGGEPAEQLLKALEASNDTD
ncbi:MAG: undecaprenyl-phosphate glucose phosphotransferase, partial [Alphaproteobacteria bacterium]